MSTFARAKVHKDRRDEVVKWLSEQCIESTLPNPAFADIRWLHVRYKESPYTFTLRGADNYIAIPWNLEGLMRRFLKDTEK